MYVLYIGIIITVNMNRRYFLVIKFIICTFTVSEIQIKIENELK